MQKEIAPLSTADLEKAKASSEESIDPALTIGSAGFFHDSDYLRLPPLERAALQLHLEEDALMEWRRNVAALRAQSQTPRNY